tara:strand:+ start:2073 stop:2672 length:600 start_codon:yes stop_codon:yes gene_type:complete
MEMFNCHKLMTYLQSYAGLLEASAVVLGLAFIIFIIRRERVGWLFGVVQCILSVLLFAELKLYAEAGLYGLYALFGIYGWWSWSANQGGEVLIGRISLVVLMTLSAIGVVLSIGTGYMMRTLTDSPRPFLDSFTSVFGLLATWLEAKQFLEAWHYWIVLNGISIGLYIDRGASFYAALMGIYFVMSFIGLRQWNRALEH